MFRELGSLTCVLRGRWTPADAGKPLSCPVTWCSLTWSCICSRTPDLSQLCHADRPWPGFWGNALDVPQRSQVSRCCALSGLCPTVLSLHLLKSYSQVGTVCLSLESYKFSPFLYLPASSGTHSRIRGVLWERMFPGAIVSAIHLMSLQLHGAMFSFEVKLSSLENLSSRKLTAVV